MDQVFSASRLSQLVPPSVSVFETRSLAWNEKLFPEEHEYVANSIRSRQDEFRTGRYCARKALHRLGIPAISIPAGSNREPIWPYGYIGSITHCNGFCAAAVARK